MKPLEREFTRRYARAFPQFMLSQGYWAAMEEWIVPDERRQQAVQEFITWARSAAQTHADQIEAALLRREADLQEFIWQQWRPWTYDPSYFNFADGLAWFLMHAPFPADERLRQVQAYLEQIPLYVDAIRRGIELPTREHLRLAIIQNMGAVQFIERLLQSLLSETTDSFLQQRVSQLWERVVQAISLFITWLHEQLRTRKTFRSYRLGQRLYETLWQLELQVEPSPEQVYRRAQEELHRVRARLHERVQRLVGRNVTLEEVPGIFRQWQKRFQTPADQWLSRIREQLNTLRSFIIQQNLIELEGLPPLRVRVTPEYMRGSGAGASVTAPGPFQQDKVIYYNVDPVNEMPPDHRDSFLAEYNQKTLYILNIHEAYPGHYVQLGYALNYAPLLANLLGNTAFIEGWAVYSEQLMLEAGFGQDDPYLKAFYDKWYLRVIANMILDFETHVIGITSERALRFLTEICLQESAEAQDKWWRARVTAVQLSSYFTGNKELWRLRHLWEQYHPDASVKDFHQYLLKQGSLPFRLHEALLGPGEGKH